MAETCPQFTLNKGCTCLSRRKRVCLDDERNTILLFNLTNEDSNIHGSPFRNLDLAGVKYMGGSGTCPGSLFTQTLKTHF